MNIDSTDAVLLNKLINTVYYTTLIEKKLIDEKIQQYTNENDAMVRHIFFRQFLGSFIDTRLHSKKDDGRAFFTTAGQQFNGKAKEYMQLTGLKILHKNNSPVFKQYLSEFLATSKDATYRFYATTNFSNNALEPALKAQLENSEGVRMAFDEIIKKNTNKLIYIDFWASWCLPCREEMTYSRELQKQYASKPITFMFVSIDNKKTSWQKAVIDEQLNNNNNNFLLFDHTLNY